MEKLLPAHPAIEIEERYRTVLRDNRARDAAAGRTLDGPHVTDLSVVYARKNIAAARRVDRRTEGAADRARARAREIDHRDDRFAPVLLLDEIVAHLDPGRRAALHGELAQLGAQVWMTGADPALFAEIADGAPMIEVRRAVGMKTER